MTVVKENEVVGMSFLCDRGPKGIEEYQKQAQQLGMVIDEKLLHQAEPAGDKIDILASIIITQAVTAFVKFAPSMINFIERLKMAQSTWQMRLTLEKSIEVEGVVIPMTVVRLS